MQNLLQKQAVNSVMVGNWSGETGPLAIFGCTPPQPRTPDSLYPTPPTHTCTRLKKNALLTGNAWWMNGALHTLPGSRQWMVVLAWFLQYPGSTQRFSLGFPFALCAVQEVSPFQREEPPASAQCSVPKQREGSWVYYSKSGESVKLFAHICVLQSQSFIAPCQQANCHQGD